MIEKVNPKHPDKIADRVAGAIVDLAYKKMSNPLVAVEVLLGHGNIHIIIETNVKYTKKEINEIVKRIVGVVKVDLVIVKQDIYLSNYQKD